MAGDLLQNALIYLGSAILFVPIAKKLGIGSVLGYIMAGIITGPFVLGLIGHEGEDVMHTAEFGVVMMLFIIGLELSPQSFWKMKQRILGLGGLQMLFTALFLYPMFAWIFGFSVNTAAALALSFSMSSTAIVLQTLKEKSLDKSEAGRSAFAVLLFQDIAVIPLLALLPLLAGIQQSGVDHYSSNPILQFLQTHTTITLLSAIGIIYLSSRFILNPFLHYIGRTGIRELFTAAALLIVIGISWMMIQVGISAALGAFFAGVMLANSEFRHELESDIEPFKGLLLGVFFTAVGSTINFQVIADKASQILLAVVLIMLLKSAVLFLLGRRFRIGNNQNLLFALLLSQAGEFVFVLLSSVLQLKMLDKSQGDFWMAVVTLSMIVSPLLLFMYEKMIAPRYLRKMTEPQPDYHVDPDEEHTVIIAGFGHFGSNIGRFLRANHVKATYLDMDIDRVQFLRRMGFNVHYGDATRLDLLEAAGAAKAKILISAIDDPAKTEKLAELAKKHFPHLQLFLRARNRYDAYNLMEHAYGEVTIEGLHSSVHMAADVLTQLGHRRYTVTRKAADFIRYDTASMEKLIKEREDMNQYISQVKEEIAEQEKLLQEDRKFMDKIPDSAWDNTPLKT